jgi:sugar phosphate permease
MTDQAIPEQRWLRVIFVAFVMYTIAFIDRTNISNALPSMSRDLHMDSAQAGNAAGIFFWGYIVLQIPGGYLASRWSAKRFVSILLVAWGLCSVATGFVRSSHEFWVMRLLLGVTEGGVWPAVLVLLAQWFPRAERARANAYWMLCLPIAVIISSPLSGWILAHWNWRVLLISEGLLPFVWLIIWLTQIVDHPHQAGWISREEREYLEGVLRHEMSLPGTSPKDPFLKTLLNPQVMVLVIVYFLINCGNYGYLFWLPSALEASQKMGNLLVGVLQAIPYVMTAFGMVLVSRHSDRWRERRGHVAIALAWGGLFLLASVALSHRAPLLSFVCICLVGAGSYGGHGPFWAIPSETLPPAVCGSAMGLINAIGNLGGYFGPLAVGEIRKYTGNFVYAFGSLGVALLAGSLFCRLLRKAPA